MRRVALIVVSFITFALATFSLTGCTGAPPSRAVVVWISIDGLRHDYVSRDLDRLPTFATMLRSGAHTEALAPVFPSLTFPSHVSEETGVVPGAHGIVANTFYDPDTKSMYSFPDASSLILAEPIWITATRQQVRTAVVDWPMSYQQRGPVKADYFGQAFNGSETDAQRLDRLIQIWRDDKPADHHDQPLRLLMVYVADVDKAGHRNGPDGAGTRAQLVATDALLAKFVAQAQEIFRATMRPSDHLYFIITTDHGMTNIRNLVSLEHMVGADLLEWTHAVTNGNLANIYLDDVPDEKRDARKSAILAKVRAYPFAEVWPRGQMPQKYGYDQTARAGDIIIALKPGYTWSKQPKDVVQSGHSAMQIGVHGYAVEDELNMRGFAVIYSPQDNLGGKDLGGVDALQLHPTVAKLLGIHPAPGARGAAIELRGN